MLCIIAEKTFIGSGAKALSYTIQETLGSPFTALAK